MAWLKLILLIIVCLSHGQSLDLTLQRDARGADVVRAVQTKLDGSNIFNMLTTTEKQLYELFIREAAYVESQDGEENHDGGGIWGVSEEILQQTQQHTAPELLDSICGTFCINWMDVQYGDLGIPMNSGIVVSLYLHYLHRTNRTLQATATDNSRASFWAVFFRGASSGSTDHWLSRVNQLQQIEECRVNTDVVFVLDSSGSIGREYYQTAKDYVYNFTESLLSGDSDSRVGVITYSDIARVDIELDTRERETLLEEIRNLPYIAESTNTPDALCLLKSRPWRESVSVVRTAVVLTDGRSNEESERCIPGTLNSTAEEVHSLHPPVTVFAVGVSSYVLEELHIIASNQMLVDTLDSFDYRLLQQNQQSRSYFICFKEQRSVVVGDEDNGSLDRGNVARIAVTGSADEGVTVRICIDQGVIVVYGSYTSPNPSSALHDFSTILRAVDGEVTPSSCLVNHVTIEDVMASSSMDCSQCRTNSQGRKRRQSDEEMVTIYIAIEGVSDMESQFSVNSSFGNVFECSAGSCEGEYETLDQRNRGCLCECISGYERQGQECSNIDECTVMPDLCGENGACTDSSGSYTCGCLEGYEREGELCTIKPAEGGLSELIIQVVVFGTLSVALLLLVLVSALLAFGLTRYKGKKEIVTTPTLNNYKS